MNDIDTEFKNKFKTSVTKRTVYRFIKTIKGA